MKMRFLFYALFAVMLAACGNRRLSPEVLQQKIDSVRALEATQQLKLQGLNMDNVSPVVLLYDSLAIQPLPLCYTEDYVRYLPNFTFVPEAVLSFLELEGHESARAIALPETVGVRLVLLAADLPDGEYELWLYSLDEQCYPVDKILLYEPKHESEDRLTVEGQQAYFSITSDYEICIKDYADDDDKVGQVSCYVIDSSRMFVEMELLK